jgi:hypothetical protein
VQIVLLSPTFLEFTFRHPSMVVGRLLNPDRVIAIMLGVKDEAIKMEHRTCNFFDVFKFSGQTLVNWGNTP